MSCDPKESFEGLELLGFRARLVSEHFGFFDPKLGMWEIIFLKSGAHPHLKSKIQRTWGMELF